MGVSAHKYSISFRIQSLERKLRQTDTPDSFIAILKLGGAMRFSDLKALVHKTTAIMFVLGALVVAGFAQAGTSGVSGTVREKNGAAVPGASVKLSNSATGFERNSSLSDIFFGSSPGGGFDSVIARVSLSYRVAQSDELITRPF